jgi:2-dehydropantoate 2-reductase
VQSLEEEFQIEPRLLQAEALRAHPQTFDLILLSTKAYSLEAAMADFAPAVGAQTTILPLLNGMAHLDQLIARFGDAAVLGGSTRIVADLDAEGTVQSMEALHDVVFGERDRSVTARVQAIDATLQGAGFEARLSRDILAFMWNKWVFLSALGAVTCLLRGSIGEVMSAQHGPQTAAAILAEAAAIAAANGYPTAKDALQHTSDRLLQQGSPLTASMYRDLKKGAPVESEQILGDLLRRGRARGVAAPLLQAAYVQLAVYEARRQSPETGPAAR